MLSLALTHYGFLGQVDRGGMCSGGGGGAALRAWAASWNRYGEKCKQGIDF